MPLAIATLVTATLILIEHVMLWQRPWRLEPPASYILGTATIGIGVMLYCAQARHWEPAIVFWSIAGAAGGADVIAYWVRGVLAKRDAVSFQAGQIAGVEESPRGATDQDGRAGD